MRTIAPSARRSRDAGSPPPHRGGRRARAKSRHPARRPRTPRRPGASGWPRRGPSARTTSGNIGDSPRPASRLPGHSGHRASATHVAPPAGQREGGRVQRASLPRRSRAGATARPEERGPERAAHQQRRDRAQVGHGRHQPAAHRRLRPHRQEELGGRQSQQAAGRPAAAPASSRGRRIRAQGRPGPAARPRPRPAAAARLRRGPAPEGPEQQGREDGARPQTRFRRLRAAPRWSGWRAATITLVAGNRKPQPQPDQGRAGRAGERTASGHDARPAIAA